RSGGEMDAITVAREGRANALGRARLMCALTRTNGLPCRVVPGLLLESGTHDSLHFWNEVYIGNDWVPYDTALGLAEKLPPDRIALASGSAAVSATGTTSLSYRFEVDSELAAYTDLMRRRLIDSNNLVDRTSLLLLPVSTQRTLQILLLVPLGALVMTVLRSIIGLRTFGMFMPMLLALAFTATGLWWGTVFLAVVVSLALLSRILIKRLYLLLVARVAFILTLVVLLMIVLFVIGDRLNLPTVGVGAFPFVIMTMIVERISVSLEEEGLRNTLSRVVTTIISVYLTYAVIQAKFLAAFLLVFPELLVIILGLLIAVGRYTGYRLTELFRFRDLAVE
ncbi:MAG TPA: 7TM domain-containing protein, partial [Terriglobales bacterium]|nr:7TM domain-containing protein [Terriglobales bacterium]